MGDGVFLALGIASAIVVVVWAAALTVTDVRQRRLPDPLTVPAAIGSVVGCVLAGPETLLAALTWPVLYLLVALLVGGVGGGDLKLAVTVGALSAAAGGIVGVLGAVALTGVLSAGTALAVRGRAHPHGPAMLAGCAATVVVTCGGV